VLSSLTLTNCALGFTYFIRCNTTTLFPALPLFSHRCSDWSFSSPSTAADVVPSARASPFLRALTAVGATVTQTAQGYTLCPSHSSVTLSYSTQTCDEFYMQRSASWPQDCDAQQPLLSTIVTGATLCSLRFPLLIRADPGVPLDAAPADSKCREGWDTL
jgi:hypothetical protein